jgi:hypothetical protein
VEPGNRNPIALTAYLRYFFTVSESYTLHVSGNRLVPSRDSVPFEPSCPIGRYKSLAAPARIGRLPFPVWRNELRCVARLLPRQVIRWSDHDQSLTSPAGRGLPLRRGYLITRHPPPIDVGMMTIVVSAPRVRTGDAATHDYDCDECLSHDYLTPRPCELIQSRYSLAISRARSNR